MGLADLAARVAHLPELRAPLGYFDPAAWGEVLLDLERLVKFFRRRGDFADRVNGFNAESFTCSQYQLVEALGGNVIVILNNFDWSNPGGIFSVIRSNWSKNAG